MFSGRHRPSEEDLVIYESGVARFRSKRCLAFGNELAALETRLKDNEIEIHN
jgi:hypothetical protein